MPRLSVSAKKIGGPPSILGGGEDRLLLGGMAMLDYYLSSLPDDKAELSVVTSGGATGDDDSSFSRELDQRRAMELDSLDMQHDKQNYNMQSAARNSMIKRLTVGIICV